MYIYLFLLNFQRKYSYSLQAKKKLSLIFLCVIFGIVLIDLCQKSISAVTIYVITPTFYRISQKPDLVRLCNTFKLVDNMHWIVVEDSLVRTAVPSTHLNAASPKDRKKYHIKGSNQRNAGIEWLRKHRVSRYHKGVVYFADDDNTYDPRLFNEMRTLNMGATWPVGIVGGSSWEAPDDPNRIIGFWTGYKPFRRFPIDMAAFAINLDLLFIYPNASFDYKHVEQQEGALLSQLGFKSAMDLEPRAEGCSKVGFRRIFSRGAHFLPSCELFS
ncbi:unnamed protein product [Mesocestoides corti]|uniref:Galactosylgalactosylxylosylprotein 3-beta-glucuronosyltransferase n=1 Tax=Mesocestoides corti TaxID=53468 RepID=A0A158QUP2_MESCO|nr:unnamed protein product [Mesocestoides corti]